MKSLDLRKLLIIGVPCLLLAVVLLLQALSGVVARRDPATALAMFPGNGLALEQQAFNTFAAAATDPEDLPTAARAAEVQARAALAATPLAPRAHAILALAASSPQQRSQILDAASALNRRDLALQGLVLEQHLARGDYAETLKTLDQMQRVNVRMRQTFFPLLVQALNEPGTEQLFVEMLDLSAPWHELFLRFALDDAGARLKLAAIRAELTINDPEFDRRLISRLAAQGELEVAQQMYRLVQGDRQSSDETSIWAAEYPPFDWALSEEPDMRAQPSRNSETLEIFVRPGSGGVVAQRIMDFPPTAFAITTTLETGPARPGAVRIEIHCAADGRELFAAPLANGANRIAVAALAGDCAQPRLAIHARSRQGEPSLRANLAPIKLVARQTAGS